MTSLSPSKRVLTTTSDQHGGAWFRLARTSDGILCLESISETALNRSGLLAAWAFSGDVPPHIANQLADDGAPDQVARVLDCALRALRYT
jgi:hypothetical protein